MAEIENKNKPLFKDWVDKKILLYGEKDYKKALEKYNSDYLPSLIKQEWYKYYKVKVAKNNNKNTSWFERLNQSFKKNNITSIDKEVYMKIEFEDGIREKEIEFENKINLIKDLSEKSISKIKEKNDKANEKYQEKIDLLQSAYSSLKKDNNEKIKELKILIQEKEEIIESKNDEGLNLKRKINSFELHNKKLEENSKLLKQENSHLFKKLSLYEKNINDLKIRSENFKRDKNENISLINKLQSKLINQEKSLSTYKIEFKELEKIKLEKAELNNLIEQYQGEIDHYNARIDDYEDSIDHQAEKIVDYKEEVDACKIKLKEYEKLKLRFEEANNDIGDYEGKLLELEAMERELIESHEIQYKQRQKIESLFNENNALKEKDENKKKSNELSSYEIKNENFQNFSSESINSQISHNKNQEESLFKLDLEKLKIANLEQKQIDERLKEIYNFHYDDESEIEQEEIDNNILLSNEDDSQENNLAYKSYYKSLIKYIEDNIDEEEEITKEVFSLFINKYSIDEDEFIEEINTFCCKSCDELLLEEVDDNFEISKEVLKNFKIALNYNDRD